MKETNPTTAPSAPTFGKDIDYLNAAIAKQRRKFQDHDKRALDMLINGIIEGWHLHKEYVEDNSDILPVDLPQNIVG